MNHWWQCSFTVDNLDESSISSLLDDTLGSVATTYEAAYDTDDFEDTELLPGELPKWQIFRITALFNENEDIDQITSAIGSEFKDNLKSRIDTKIISDNDWQEGFKQYFPPKQFGKLWIYPSWHEGKREAPAINLDPGLAFGTGSHPTTKLCLEWLANNSDTICNNTIIDYGCGSGILSVAAIKLGASKVYAVDHDPQALSATNYNAEANNISEGIINTFLPHEAKNNISSRILIANILLQPLLDLKPVFIDALKEKEQAIVVFSGILENQVDTLIAHYKDDIELKLSATHEGWALLSSKT